MSAISGLGRSIHGASAFRSLRPAAGASPATATSITSPTLAGSVTGNAGAIAPASGDLRLNPAKLKQIERAVTGALQAARPTDDPRQVVRVAIASALKSPAAAPTSDTHPDADADGSHRTFVQTLTAYGISPQQFRAELVSAVQQASGNPQPAVSSFPPGIVLDTAA